MVRVKLSKPQIKGFALVYTGCMIANHANQVILDNLVKQNGAFDVKTAYQAMREEVSTLKYL